MIVAVLLLLALAQQSTFRASATTVEVDVTVTSADGAFVTGLSIGDFTIDEDGVPQPIDALTVVDAGPIAAAADAAALPPGDKTDVAFTAGYSRRIVWILDDLHITPGGFTRVRDGLATSIRKELRVGDVGGVVVTGFASGVRLSSDHEALLSDVKALRPSTAQQSRRALFNEWPRFGSDEEAVRLVAGDRTIHEIVLRRAQADEPKLCEKVDCESIVQEKARQIASNAQHAAQRSLEVMRGVVRALATQPGRSTVIVATEGFLTNAMRGELDRIEHEAASARVTIHVIDSRGLRESGRDITGSGQAPDVGAFATPTGDPLDGGMNGLAAVTGGRVIRHQNRFDVAFSQLAEGAGRYYILAYRPARPPERDEWRQIRVRVNRPGLRVSARLGYYARATAAVPVTPAAPAGPDASASAREASTASYAGTSPKRPDGREGGPDRPEPSVPPAPSGAPVPFGSPDLPDSRVESLRATTLRPAPRLVEERTAAAWEAYQRGDVEAVREQLAAIGATETPPWALYMLGLAEVALGNRTKAAASWEQVRAAVPTFEPVYFDLADAYISTGDLSEALGVLRAAAARWPGDEDVWNATGIVLLRRSAVDDAIAAFEKATTIAPASGLGFYNLGRALELRYERARRWSRIDRSWTINRADLAAAIFAYERAAALGGATAESATAALTRLRP